MNIMKIILLSFAVLIILVSGCVSAPKPEGIWNQMPEVSEEACSVADLNGQRGDYFADKKELRLSIHNPGQTDLQGIEITIFYLGTSKNPREVELADNLYSGQAKVFTIENVDSDIKEVIIQSMQCLSAFDKLDFMDINGVGINPANI